MIGEGIRYQKPTRWNGGGKSSECDPWQRFDDVPTAFQTAFILFSALSRDTPPEGCRGTAIMKPRQGIETVATRCRGTLPTALPGRVSRNPVGVTIILR
jgi:hypothetical protein